MLVQQGDEKFNFSGTKEPSAVAQSELLRFRKYQTEEGSAMQSTVSPIKTKSTVMFVTPEMAHDWLELNSVNRKLNKHVDYLCKLMRTGQFMMTGEPVQFEGSFIENNARLTNGQHRLSAIEITGIGQWLVVVENVEPGSQKVMDTGRRRSFADTLHMDHQVTDAYAVAALVRLSYLHSLGRVNDANDGGGKNMISPTELETWFTAHPEIPAAVPVARKAAKGSGFNVTACGLTKLIFDKIDQEASDDFFEKLNTGADLTPGDPLLAGRRWITGKRATIGDNPRPNVQAAILVKVWNDRRRNSIKNNRALYRYDVATEPFPTAI